MAQICRNNTIEKHFITESKQGEMTLNINLKLTIEQNGNVSVATSKEKEIPDYVMQVPDLEPINELIDFGKSVKT